MILKETGTWINSHTARSKCLDRDGHKRKSEDSQAQGGPHSWLGQLSAEDPVTIKSVGSIPDRNVLSKRSYSTRCKDPQQPCKTSTSSLSCAHIPVCVQPGGRESRHGKVTCSRSQTEMPQRGGSQGWGYWILIGCNRIFPEVLRLGEFLTWGRF